MPARTCTSYEDGPGVDTPHREDRAGTQLFADSRQMQRHTRSRRCRASRELMGMLPAGAELPSRAAGALHGGSSTAAAGMPEELLSQPGPRHTRLRCLCMAAAVKTAGTIGSLRAMQQPPGQLPYSGHPCIAMTAWPPARPCCGNRRGTEARVRFVAPQDEELLSGAPPSRRCGAASSRGRGPRRGCPLACTRHPSAQCLPVQTMPASVSHRIWLCAHAYIHWIPRTGSMPGLGPL